MKSYAYSRTQAGIERLAQERGRQLVVIEPPKDNVLQFRRRVAKAEHMPSIREISRAQHQLFLAGLVIRTRSQATDIIKRVSAWHGVSVEAIIGQSRVRKVVEARFDAIAAVYLNCRIGSKLYGLPDLGRIFHKDHTSAHHALRKRGL